MPNEQRTIDAKFKRKLIVKNFIPVVLVVVFLWVVYVSTAFFHFDLLHPFSNEKRERDPSTIELWIAIVGTVGFIVWGVVRLQKAISLARNGVEVEGEITHLGFIIKGHRRAECGFNYGGRDYKYIWSPLVVEGLELGQMMTLLVDPDNPDRCLPIEDVFADRAPPKKLMTAREKVVWGGLAVFVVAGFCWLVWNRIDRAWPKNVPAAAQQAPPVNPLPPLPAPPAQPVQAQMPVPKKNILFQPMFVWAGAEPTYRGTGFFVRGPGGKLFGVTCSHNVDFDGLSLLETRWLDAETRAPVAVLRQSWGEPGRVKVIRYTRHDKPIEVVEYDKRSDYLLMPAPDNVPAGAALELDERDSFDSGEAVYFHDKCSFGDPNYTVATGILIQSPPEQIQVNLDRPIQPDSQFGSPVISQKTGKVIGMLAAIGNAGPSPSDPVGFLNYSGGPSDLLVLTPASSIRKAIEAAHDARPLSDVVGKRAVQGGGKAKQ